MKYDFTKVKEYKFYNFVRGLAKILCRSKYKINYIGLENIPKDGGFILACNHQNALDPVIIASAMKRPVHFMAKEELFENNSVGFFLKHFNAFPVVRGSGDMSAVNYAENIVKNGWILGIFPEGTRSKDFKPARGKSGVALVAKQTEADILPVCIYTSDEFKNGTKLTVRFGKIIPYRDLGFTEERSAKELRFAAKKIMGEVVTLWEKGHE